MEDENILQKYPFFTYIKCISKSNPEIYGDFSNNKKSFLYHLEFCERLILKYITKKEDKRKIRNIRYIIKIFKDVKSNKKYKKYNPTQTKIINQIFIIFFFYLSKYCFTLGMDNNLLRKINFLFDSVLNIIGKCYQDKIINDEYFEIFLKLLLFLTISPSINKEPNEKNEIINMLFFKKCINILKIVFNNLIKLQNKFTQRQEEIINNIIKCISDNIFITTDKSNRLSYILM